MKESDLNKRAMDYVMARCQYGVYYKIADRFTRGIPDSVFTWSDCTSWLEFKLLDPNESIHAQLDKDQLVELVRLSRAGHRAWVVAFRRPAPRRQVPPKTVFYAPKMLLHGHIPVARELSLEGNVLRDLNAYGVAEFEGHNYEALWQLIHQTHASY